MNNNMTPAREKLARWCGCWRERKHPAWRPDSYFSSPAFAMEEVWPRLVSVVNEVRVRQRDIDGRADAFIYLSTVDTVMAFAPTPHEALLLAAEKVVEAMGDE